MICAESAKKKQKSRAEIQRAYRQRRLAENADKIREKELQLQWHKRRTEKKIKGIDDMTERDRRVIRKRWLERRHEHRRIKKHLCSVTPPASTDDNENDVAE